MSWMKIGIQREYKSIFYAESWYHPISGQQNNVANEEKNHTINWDPPPYGSWLKNGQAHYVEKILLFNWLNC